MNLKDLVNWTISEYNEDTAEQLDYYINESACNIGDIAYLYSHENDELTKMKILYIIRQSDDMDYYDMLICNNDILLDGESERNADTSAEFITDNDCYLVWFKYID